MVVESFPVYAGASDRRHDTGLCETIVGDLEIYDPGRTPARTSQLLRARPGYRPYLENQPREGATVADLSGPVQDPDASTWQIIANLLRNAFIEAILPGFAREAESGSSG